MSDEEQRRIVAQAKLQQFNKDNPKPEFQKQKAHFGKHFNRATADRYNRYIADHCDR